MSVSLPLLGQPRPERADAAENRRKILAAAETLFASQDPTHVTMDAIAAAAGVGKGTLFRRFGDRATLARTLLSTREAALQDSLIRGEPPLGPGAPPLERLIAFCAAYLRFLEGHRHLLRAAEAASDTPLAGAPYGFYRTHVTVLLREAGLGDRSPFLADVILAPLVASMYSYLRDVRRLSCEELADAHADLCRRLVLSTG